MREVDKNNDYFLMGAQLSYVTERNMSFRDKYEAGQGYVISTRYKLEQAF